MDAGSRLSSSFRVGVARAEDLVPQERVRLSKCPKSHAWKVVEIATISLRSDVLSGCVDRVRLSITTRQDQIWQRKVEQSLDDWVEHESVSRFSVRNCERFEKKRRRKIVRFFLTKFLRLSSFKASISPVRRRQWSSSSCWSWIVEIVWSGHRSRTALSRWVAPVLERPCTWPNWLRSCHTSLTGFVYKCHFLLLQRVTFLVSVGQFPIFMFSALVFGHHSCLHCRWLIWF